MQKYIHERAGYPKFTWDALKILDAVTRAAHHQGELLGKMQQFGFDVRREAVLHTLTEEITKSSEIEGEILNSEQVRSSLAKRLDIQLKNPPTESHHIDGIVQTMMDAVNKHALPLSEKRLFGWHAALFPTGYSGIRKIRIAKYRTEEMQIVSSKNYTDTVHYKAPLPVEVPAQMGKFLSWLNADGNENPLLKAAIAHVWFVIIHPFDDGNGRLARTITEMLLARAEHTNLRFYSLSRQIQKEKKGYYALLGETTTGTLDITQWLVWFFGCLERAIDGSADIVGKVLEKAAFWQKHALDITNEVQREIINLLLAGFSGNMTSGKAAKIYKISQDTAARFLGDLAERGFLSVQGAGRSTHYVLRK